MSLVPEWVVDLQQYRRDAEPTLVSGRVRCDALGHVYVADPPRGCVYKFDASGGLVFRIAPTDVPSGLKQPRDMAIDRNGELFVTEFTSSARVLRFDARGRLRGSFVPEAPADAIAIDSLGSLYLHIPSSPWRIHKYAAQGEKILTFGPRPEEGAPSAAMEDAPRPKVYELLSSIAIDGADRVYFAPCWTYDIPRFTAEGHVTGYLRRRLSEMEIDAGRGLDSLKTPWTAVVFDIAVSPPDGDVYVLRARSRDGHSQVDFWRGGGADHREIELPHRGVSIACDEFGSVYLLHSWMPESTVSLVKYVQGGSNVGN